jgi:hypothetical protein
MNSEGKLCELLPGFEQNGQTPVCIGGQPFYSEGTIVRFFSSDGTSWVGNFAKGGIATSEVIEFPKARKVFVFSGGDLYIMNPDQQQPLKRDEQGYYAKTVKLDDGRYLTYNLQAIMVIEKDGTYWKSEEISLDGMRNVSVKDNIVSGLAYNYYNHDDPWEPFTFDINTKVITGKFWEILHPKK